MSLLGRLFAVTMPPLDPIDHPALRAMALRELADLPFPRPEPRPLPAAEPSPRTTDDGPSTRIPGSAHVP